MFCFQIAFQLLNPFPMQKIRTKRAHHLDIVKVSWQITAVSTFYLRRRIASLATFNSKCSESDRNCSDKDTAEDFQRPPGTILR